MGNCIYCNSTTYGRPCLFSPSNTHVIFGDPHKCIYCGSRSLGTGCLFNPFGKIHVRGPEYLMNVKEQSERSVILKYLYENLNNQNEQDYNSPLKRFYKRVCNIISTASQPLLESLNLQSKPSFAKLTKEQHIKAFEIKNRLSEEYSKISETLRHANLSLPQEIIEEILVDVIISSDKPDDQK
jgi:hypothetical protein